MDKIVEKEELLETKKAKTISTNCNQYDKEILCELTNINCKYQNNYIQTGKIINNYNGIGIQNDNTETKEKPKIKVRKMVR